MAASGRAILGKPRFLDHPQWAGAGNQANGVEFTAGFPPARIDPPHGGARVGAPALRPPSDDLGPPRRTKHFACVIPCPPPSGLAGPSRPTALKPRDDGTWSPFD